MARNRLLLDLIMTIIVLGFLSAGQPIQAESPPASETTGKQETAPGDDSKDASGGPVAVGLSQNEIDSIAAALPEGEVKQMFKEKAATGAKTDNAPADEEPVEGEEIATLFFESEKAFSRVQKQIRALFTKPTSAID